MHSEAERRGKDEAFEMLRCERRKATVMSADVSGFSRMMAENDLETLETLLECMESICDLVERFGGRVVDAPGDNLLAEFPERAQAVDCAVAVQRRLERENRVRSRAQRMLFRIGLHSGAVLARGGRIYGDVVNLAARLQASAAPQEIALSAAVAERAHPELQRGLLERGLQQFKNIPYALSSFALR
jgi:adenylate cyclase